MPAPAAALGDGIGAFHCVLSIGDPAYTHAYRNCSAAGLRASMAPRGKKVCTPTLADHHSQALETMRAMGFDERETNEKIVMLQKVSAHADQFSLCGLL